MIRGSVVALITPFLENGELDLESFKRLIHFHREQGTKGLVIAGTTGESPTLSEEELDLLISSAVKESKGRIPIIAGVGTYSTKESVMRAMRAKERGADACLAVFPYYNRPMFHGCLAHFKAIAECALPLIVYYHPGRTGVQLPAVELAEICSLPGVMALKDCSGKPAYALEVKKLCNKSLFSGDDSLIIPFMEGGADGLISVIANLFPSYWNRLIETALKGDIETAKSLYETMDPLCRALSLETNPQGIKYAMSLMGHCSPVLRLPLTLPQKGPQLRIKEEIDQLLSLDLCEQMISYS